jgi:hypothetical protein
MYIFSVLTSSLVVFVTNQLMKDPVSRSFVPLTNGKYIYIYKKWLLRLTNPYRSIPHQKHTVYLPTFRISIGVISVTNIKPFSITY